MLPETGFQPVENRVPIYNSVFYIYRYTLLSCMYIFIIERERVIPLKEPKRSIYGKGTCYLQIGIGESE